VPCFDVDALVRIKAAVPAHQTGRVANVERVRDDFFRSGTQRTYYVNGLWYLAAELEAAEP
jgi:hypothetical protein